MSSLSFSFRFYCTIQFSRYKSASVDASSLPSLAGKAGNPQTTLCLLAYVVLVKLNSKIKLKA